jgi:hypothetical protein
LVLKTFFFILKLNCSFPKIYHQKYNIILRVFFLFCFFVLCFCLFFVICWFFVVLFFFIWFVCCYFTFFVTNITFRIGYKQNWSMRRRFAVIMKNHGGDIYFTLFNVPYIKPRDSYVNNFCRFKKKRKTTFNHLLFKNRTRDILFTHNENKIFFRILPFFYLSFSNFELLKNNILIVTLFTHQFSW